MPVKIIRRFPRVLDNNTKNRAKPCKTLIIRPKYKDFTAIWFSQMQMKA